MKAAIVLCSGGLDSVVTAHFVKKKLGYDTIHLLFFDYGQRSLTAERAFSKNCARDLCASFTEINLNYLKNLSKSGITKRGPHTTLTRKDLKDTAEESKKWYVPARNLVFLSNALALAESLFITQGIRSDIFVGFKHEGAESYPDATNQFVAAINRVSTVGSEGKFTLYAPFIKKNKEDIIVLGKKLDVDLRKTISCYTARRSCGTCLSCALRKEGFRWAGIEDPTEYAAVSD